MRRKLLVLLMALVVLGAALATSGCLGPLTGTVSVVSNPAGLAIALDGADTGKVTPADLTVVAGVAHTITVSSAAFGPQTKTTTVSEQQTIVLSFAPDDLRAIVTGIVTNTRGGPALGGATVNIGGEQTTTADDGTYSLKVMPASGYTIEVSKDGFGTSRYLPFDVTAATGETAQAPVMVARPEFSPSKPNVPPTIVPKGLAALQALSGNPYTFTVEVAGQNGLAIRNLDWRLGSLDSLVRDGRAWDAGPSTLEQKVSLDTTLHANGATTLYLTAYDYNYNCTTVAVPVTVSNAASQPVVVGQPGDPWATAYTYSMPYGYFSKPSPLAAKVEQAGASRGLSGSSGRVAAVAAKLAATVSAGRTLFVDVKWLPAAGAKGYRVLRSLQPDSGWVDTHLAAQADAEIPGRLHALDGSPGLTAGTCYYYKVVPYAGDTEGTTSEVAYATPLPAFGVNLVGPANRATVATLTPTFEWSIPAGFGGPGTDRYYTLTVLDTSGAGMDADVFNAYVLVSDRESITFGDTSATIDQLVGFRDLLPSHRYQWDLHGAEADRYDNPAQDGGNWPTAVSYSGSGDVSGALNGAWDFVTPSDK